MKVEVRSDKRSSLTFGGLGVGAIFKPTLSRPELERAFMKIAPVEYLGVNRNCVDLATGAIHKTEDDMAVVLCREPKLIGVWEE